MAVVSSIFWILGLSLSVTLGPQLRIWTWGGAMLCLGLAVIFALPAIWAGRANKGNPVIETCGALLVVWLGARACVTTVVEAGEADYFLVAMSVATFVCFRAIGTSINAQRVLMVGIALLTVASLFVVARQFQHPGYSPVFGDTGMRVPTGFYGHYSYGASFLVAVSSILVGLALHSKGSRAGRVMLGMIAILGFVAVYYTRSRGAILGATGSFAALAVYTMITGKRESRNWFGPAVIATPLIIAGIVLAVVYGLSGAQVARNGSPEAAVILDNTIRWHLSGIAMSCIALHPLLGGGARSFSWECYRFWDVEMMGQGKHKPEHVHNELLQTACDYGIIGAVLLIVFLTCIVIVVTVRTASEKTDMRSPYADGWRIGGIVGFAGLFVQSNFEGILRIAPGAILLAACISAACFQKDRHPKEAGNKPWLRLSVISLLALASAFTLILAGIKGTRVSLLIWPMYFGSYDMGHESKIDALSKAIDIWPMQSLILRRAIAYQESSRSEENDGMKDEMIGLALADFKRSTELHPYDPQSLVGYGNILSSLKRNGEAEATYAKAVKLQGGMEAGFQAHFNSARHYHRKAVLAHDPENPAALLADLEIAARHIEEAYTTAWRNVAADHDMRVQIHQDYGRILEAVGEYQEAMEQYDFASKIPRGGSSHYYAGQLLGRLAVKKWGERNPEDAMLLFMQAAHRINAAGDGLPENITPVERDEYARYLRNTVEYLKGARIKPSEKVDY